MLLLLLCTSNRIKQSFHLHKITLKFTKYVGADDDSYGKFLFSGLKDKVGIVYINDVCLIS